MAAGDMSAVSAPAAPAAPAAPVSAPSNPSPAAPAAPISQPAAPASPAASAPQQGPRSGESNVEYLRRVQFEKLGKEVPKDSAPSDTVSPVGEEFYEDKPVIPENGEQPDPDAKPVEEPNPEDKPAAPKEGEQPKDGESPEEEEALSLDDPELLDPRGIAARLKENPEAEAALEKAGISRNELFATARIAAKGQKFMELFNGDVETAQNAVEQSEKFGALSQLFTNQQSLDDTNALLRTIMEFDYELDDDGKPVMVDVNGQQVPKAASGSVGKFIDNTFQIGLKYWTEKAKASGNEDLAAACQEIQAEYERASGSAQPPDYSNLDEQTRARLDAADKAEKQLAAQRAADETRKEQEFELNVTKGIESSVDAEITKLLSTATLSDGQKKWALDQIKERVTNKLKASTSFFNKLDVIMRRPMSEKTSQLRVAHGLNSARPLLRGVAREVLSELGVQIQTKRDAEQARTAAQVQAGRSEVKGASQPAKPGANVTAADINKMAREELTAAGKDPSNTTLMFQQVFLIKKRLGVK